MRILGPPLGAETRGGLLSFVMENLHAHDVVTLANERGLALRGGHHCTQPLMRKLGLASSARASFYFYNTEAEVDRMVAILAEMDAKVRRAQQRVLDHRHAPAPIDLEELYEVVVADHSSRPRNFGTLGEGAVHVHGDNPSCGDEIHLHVKFGPEKVEEVKFTGHGCTISMASASMMTDAVKGKTIAEAEKLYAGFHDMVTGEPGAEPDPDRLASRGGRVPRA